MTKSTLLLILLVAVQSTIEAQTQLQKEENILMAGARLTDLNISSEERGAIIRDLRAVASDFADQRHFYAREALVVLGDIDAIKNVVTEYQGSDLAVSSRAASTLARSRQLEVIPLIVHNVFSDEKLRPRVIEGVGHKPLSFSSMDMIRAILITAPEVPPDITVWAQSLPHAGYIPMRDAIRKFWSTNEQKFKTHEYSTITVPE